MISEKFLKVLGVVFLLGFSASAELDNEAQTLPSNIDATVETEAVLAPYFETFCWNKQDGDRFRHPESCEFL